MEKAEARLTPQWWPAVRDALEWSYKELGRSMVDEGNGTRSYSVVDWNLACKLVDYTKRSLGQCAACSAPLTYYSVIRCLDCKTTLCESCAPGHFGTGHAGRSARAHPRLESQPSGFHSRDLSPEERLCNYMAQSLHLRHPSEYTETELLVADHLTRAGYLEPEPQGSYKFIRKEVSTHVAPTEAVTEALPAPNVIGDLGVNFQTRVYAWLQTCFGIEIASSPVERNFRLAEEATELLQSAGFTKEEFVKVLDYVYSRPVGLKHQELGGTMVTLAAWSVVNFLDMQAEGERELNRVWMRVPEIREKQKRKPTELRSPHKGI